jgi:putative transposase
MDAQARGAALASALLSADADGSGGDAQGVPALSRGDGSGVLCSNCQFAEGIVRSQKVPRREHRIHSDPTHLDPAVGLAQSGCELRHPRNQEYLLPEKALAHAARKAMKEALARDHPEIFARIEPAVWQKSWVAQAQGAGRGRTALRYLAAYVKKSAFSEGRLLGYDQTGHIVLSYRDSADGKLKSEALDPLELIRRWLLHVLPKGLVRVRHYGWLSAAAHKAFLRVRFLLGLGPYRIPPALKSEPPRCPFCNGLLAQIVRIAPQRGPPLCQAILKAAA